MNNEKYTQTNSTNEPVHCKDCQHHVLSKIIVIPMIESAFFTK